jgi:hypothetical protein
MIALAAMLPQSLTAQNEGAGGQSSNGKEYRGPLPIYFGKLGLSEPQKEKCYTIQDSYEERIAALKKQIEDLETERDQSMETLLTPGQKLRLKELREEALLKEEADRNKKAKAATAAATADASGEPAP